jgi:hypothetical protein
MLLGLVFIASIAVGYLSYDADPCWLYDERRVYLLCALLPCLGSLFFLWRIQRLSADNTVMLLPPGEGARLPRLPLEAALPLLFVIGAVLMLAVPAGEFLHPRCQGSLTACKSNLKNIGTAMEMYSSDNQGRYPRDLSYITPNYLKTLPTCGASGIMSYRYTCREKPDIYTAWCSGDYHRGTYLPGFPQYDAVDGLRER